MINSLQRKGQPNGGQTRKEIENAHRHAPILTMFRCFQTPGLLLAFQILVPIGHRLQGPCTERSLDHERRKTLPPEKMGKVHIYFD